MRKRLDLVRDGEPAQKKARLVVQGVRCQISDGIAVLRFTVNKVVHV